jgi:hypothetical protein
MIIDLTLVIPAKRDPERDSVAEVWRDAGGDVERLDRFWEPPEHLQRSRVRLYGNDTFCLVVAQKLNLTLISPDDKVLASAPDFLKRTRPGALASTAATHVTLHRASPPLHSPPRSDSARMVVLS